MFFTTFDYSNFEACSQKNADRLIEKPDLPTTPILLMISIDIDRNEPGNLSSDSWWSQKKAIVSSAAGGANLRHGAPS